LLVGDAIEINNRGVSSSLTKEGMVYNLRIKDISWGMVQEHVTVAPAVWVIGASRIGLLLLIGSLFGLIAACGGGAEPAATTPPQPPATPTASLQGVDTASQWRAIQTASYRIELGIGPVVTMMTSFPIMSMTDQAQPVNRHFEVHIFDKSSGAKVMDMIPTVRITDQVTGSSRELATDQATGSSQGVAFVMACSISKHRVIEPHFGDNLYLPDGEYTVTVGVGNETAIYENIAVKAAGSPGM